MSNSTWQPRELELDSGMFAQQSPPNRVPQESKLATYMNRTTTPTPRPVYRCYDPALTVIVENNAASLRKVVISDYGSMNFYGQHVLMPTTPEGSPPSSITGSQFHQENVGGTTYFYSTPDGGHNSSGTIGPNEQRHGVAVGAGIASPYSSPLFSAGPSAPAHVATPTRTGIGLTAAYDLPETIRNEIHLRNADVNMRSNVRQYPANVPENVDAYTDLLLLEDIVPTAIATSYRAAHRENGELFALRRLRSYTLVATKRLQMWKQIDHPNIVKLHHWVTTRCFGDHSLVLVYTYHPASMTLMKKYLCGPGSSSSDSNGAFHDPFSSDPDAPRPYTHQKNTILRAVACGALLPEAILWSLLVQLTAALRAIHTAGLACRNLDATKVVMHGCRVRIAWCGAFDALHINTNDIPQAQQDDLTALGRLALSLACRTVHCDNLGVSMDLISRTYSADLKNLILYLLSTSTHRSVTDLMPMIGARFYSQVESLEKHIDVCEDQLAREIDNGRLLRILIKLGVVNERPEMDNNALWSETGDRYLLKLFRDYLFHSVSDTGRPWIDQAHVIYCLNQLDSGSSNKVVLTTRDDQSVLVVSYADLKAGLEKAFREVVQGASAN